MIQRGKYFRSKECREKSRVSHLGISHPGAGRGRTAWNKGKTGIYSKDTLKKMSEGRIGVVPANKGKRMSYSLKKKISEKIREIFQTKTEAYRTVFTEEGPKAEHRFVIEKNIGRKLKNKEVIHHWNEKKDDNRSENLCLFRTNGVHWRLHRFANRHNLPVILLKFSQNWLYVD
jgi:hypothetical protein